MTCVLLPTAPSPMTGFLLVVDSEKVTDAPITHRGGDENDHFRRSGGACRFVPPLNQKTLTAALPESFLFPNRRF
jgi:uncharacterized membrane protein